MMRPSLRQLALLAHVSTSVGWLGAAGAFLVLAIAGAASRDAQLVRSAYTVMSAVLSYVIVPIALGSLLTGLVSSLGTQWGLFRHYWVVVKLALTTLATLILIMQMQPIAALSAAASQPSFSIDVLRATPKPLVHAAGGIVVLLAIQVLGIYKPRGMTPYGWRQNRAMRKAQA